MRKNARIIIGMLSIMFILLGCSKAPENVVKILIPNGSPSLTQLVIEYQKPSIANRSYRIERVFGSDPLIAAFLSESHDIVYAPVNTGAQLISMGANYRFVATVTWGNLYLASAKEINQLEDLEGETLVVFGQNAIPDIVLMTLLESINYDSSPEIIYVDSVQTCLGMLMQDETRIVLLAEPLMSIALESRPALHTIDLQAAWQLKQGTSAYPQAGVFVHNQLSNEFVTAYLEALERSIEYVNDNPQEAAQMAVNLAYPNRLETLYEAIPRSHLRFQTAYESKDSIEHLFLIILGYNSALINHEMPEDAFYEWGQTDE